MDLVPAYPHPCMGPTPVLVGVGYPGRHRGQELQEFLAQNNPIQTLALKE